MAEQRYRVIDRLESGGMAEVYRGEAVSVEGFRKPVAIKRVLPHLAQNRAFIAMFLDEARLGARLNHANIVSVFDIGAADNTYFIVMEYVEGANLKMVHDVLCKQGRVCALRDAIFIVMEACRGLSYAHELTDEEGRPLHIVHRDVSPPNILISKRGEVKVADFGLAKAATQLEKTDPGVVKGKFAYLSPEAATGHDVDGRADVFAAGVVLWELLAGRRLFLGNNDYQTVRLVQEANVPLLSGVHPVVDSAFDEILQRALAREPNERFQTAREFGDALAGYVFGRQMKVTSYDLANLVNEVLAATNKDRDVEESVIDRLIQEELLLFTSIEDMSDPLNPGSTPLSPEDVQGERSVRLSLENPAEWFRDDVEIAAAIGGRRAERVELVAGAAVWSETGLDAGDRHSLPGELSALLEADSTVVDVVPPQLREDLQRADSAGAPAAGQPSARRIERTTRKPWLVVFFIAVVVAGVAAALWLGGVGPLLGGS